MPYISNEDLPSWVKKYSEDEQKLFREKFNSTYEQYEDDTISLRVANVAIKNYRIKKKKEQPIKEVVQPVLDMVKTNTESIDILSRNENTLTNILNRITKPLPKKEWNCFVSRSKNGQIEKVNIKEK